MTLGRLQDAIHRKDSSGLKQLLEPLAISDSAKEEILLLPRLFGGREVLDKAARVGNPQSRQALENLVRIFEILEAHEVGGHLTLDLGEIRGLDYHTGITFQGFLPGLGRAVCAGGRYDNLTARYGRQAPATGFTFNLLNLLFALDRQLDERVAGQTDVLLVQPGDDKRQAQTIARLLRAKGYSVARDMVPRELDASLDYARKMGYRYLLIINPAEAPLQLQRVADGQRRPLRLSDLQSADFIL